MDGANLNALVGLVRPGDLGFDVHAHQPAQDVLDAARRRRSGRGSGRGRASTSSRSCRCRWWWSGTARFVLDHDRPQSVGRVHAFHGNFGILVRALTYMLTLGPEGLRRGEPHGDPQRQLPDAPAARTYDLPHRPARACTSSCCRAAELRKHGVKTLDVAKRLLDFGVHAPTVYFPLIVEEALMIEPTETETLDSLESATRRRSSTSSSGPRTT